MWKDDIAYYFFLGGLAAGCSLLAAGADQTGRPALRRGTRLTALGRARRGPYYLIHDLGRPERFHHMLRVAKPTSPMSMGTWVLAAYGPPMGVAAISEVMPARLRRTLPGRLVDAAARPAGPRRRRDRAGGRLVHRRPAVADRGPGLARVAPRAAVHLHGQRRGQRRRPGHDRGPDVARPPRRGGFAMFGAIVELAASRRLENRLGPGRGDVPTGDAGRYLERASTLTAAGVLGSMLLGRRSRVAAVAVRAWPCSPAGSTSGSACCTPASSRRRTRSTSSSPSASASRRARRQGQPPQPDPRATPGS